jgi:hypothetical protein
MTYGPARQNENLPMFVRSSKSSGIGQKLTLDRVAYRPTTKVPESGGSVAIIEVGIEAGSNIKATSKNYHFVTPANAGVQ